MQREEELNSIPSRGAHLFFLAKGKNKTGDEFRIEG